MIVDSITWWRDHLQRDASVQSTCPNLKVAFVKYEDLHNDVILQRKRLFEFLDVDPKLAQPLNDKLKPGIEVEAPEKFNRKGAVGDWKNYFHDDVKSWFKDIAGESLIVYEYTKSNDW